MAGVTRKVSCTRQKLYQQKCSATAARIGRSALLKAFVSLVSRRMCMRMVMFCRSTREVLIRLSSG
jgi:hypothetical protein